MQWKGIKKKNTARLISKFYKKIIKYKIYKNIELIKFLISALSIYNLTIFFFYI